MDSKRSNCSFAVCCGIPVEKVCFIFAIINAVVCCLATLTSKAWLIFMLCTWFDGEPRSSNDMVLVYLFTGLGAAGLLGSVIAVAFAVLLCLGIRKSNKRYVMAYLVYGIITVILSVLGTLGFLWMEWGEKDLMMYALIPLVVCVLYSGILMLVYQTYVVLSDSERTPMTGHRRLLNKSDC